MKEYSLSCPKMDMHMKGSFKELVDIAFEELVIFGSISMSQLGQDHWVLWSHTVNAKWEIEQEEVATIYPC